MKSKKALFAIVVLAIVTAFALVACNGGGSRSKNIVLKDFPATVTEEAQALGSVYTLRTSVEDEDGNSYTLSASVKTQVGGDVTVISGKFDLTDKSGYTVTYSATVAEGDVRTSVVTVPVYDAAAPMINIPTPEGGIVGKLYTLPNISISDDFGVESSSVNLYLVKGSDPEELEEVALELSDGKYTFTPAEKGVYRIVVTATDAAQHQTVRTADFIVDVLLDGEVFNPASLGAREQLRTNKDPDVDFSYVSAEENDDEVYGGAYWLVKPDMTGWVNTHLVPRLELSQYEGYDLITFWAYVESTGGGNFNMSFLNDVECQKTGVATNTWLLIELDIDKFVEKINSQYFYAISYGSITGVRVGEIMARKTVDYTISTPSVTLISASSAATASFTVTSDPEGIEPAVKVVGERSGVSLTPASVEDGEYTYSITQPDVYNVTVTAQSYVYYGSATATFEAKRDTRIEVDGSYPDVVEEGETITLLSAHVISGSSPTGASVTVKVYKYVDGDWVDDSSNIQTDTNKTYTPSGTEDLKIVYSADDTDNEEYVIKVVRAGEIFDPEYEGAREQLSMNKSSTFTFVTATENTDETYGGAYWKIVPGATGWANTSLIPRLEDLSLYAKYDVITFWVFVEGTNIGATGNLAILNDSDCAQQFTAGKWTLATISVTKFIEKVKSQYFCSLSYSSSITGIRIGEIMARKNVEFTVSEPEVTDIDGNTPATVSFTVTSTPVGITPSVKVKSQSGEVVSNPTVNGNQYTYSISKKGTYTIEVTAANSVYYGSATKSVEVRSNIRIQVDGEYPSVVEEGVELTLKTAQVYAGDSATGASVAVKVYKYLGGSWADDSSNIQTGKYTPSGFEDLKIVYSADNADDEEITVKVGAVGEVFDPTRDYAGNSVSTSGAAFANSVKSFVPADENDDSVYSGAYYQFTAGAAGWSDVNLTSRFDRSYYDKFDFVSVWVYFGTADGTTATVFALPFGNTNHHHRRIVTNKWTKFVLVKPRDGMTGNYAQSVFYSSLKTGDDTSVETFNFAKFITVNFTASVNVVKLGEVYGGMFDDVDAVADTLFDPAGTNAATSVGANSGTLTTSGVSNPDASGAYTGACISWTTPASGWANFYLRPDVMTVQELALYSKIKVWIYIKTGGASADFEFAMYNETRARQKVKTNTWVELELDVGRYINYIATNANNAGNPYLFSSNAWGGGVLYVGAATAIQYQAKA